VSPGVLLRSQIPYCQRGIHEGDDVSTKSAASNKNELGFFSFGVVVCRLADRIIGCHAIPTHTHTHTPLYPTSASLVRLFLSRHSINHEDSLALAVVAVVVLPTRRVYRRRSSSSSRSAASPVRTAADCDAAGRILAVAQYSSPRTRPLGQAGSSANSHDDDLVYSARVTTAAAAIRNGRSHQECPRCLFDA
jgi:hypothetical protein